MHVQSAHTHGPGWTRQCSQHYISMVQPSAFSFQLRQALRTRPSCTNALTMDLEPRTQTHHHQIGLRCWKGNQTIIWWWRGGFSRYLVRHSRRLIIRELLPPFLADNDATPFQLCKSCWTGPKMHHNIYIFKRLMWEQTSEARKPFDFAHKCTCKHHYVMFFEHEIICKLPQPASSFHPNGSCPLSL